MGAARQVAEELAHLAQRIGLVHRLVVDQGALAVHLVATQVILVDGDAVGLLDHRRAGREDLRLVATLKPEAQKKIANSR